ncbi:hypothetical protein [Pseudorhodoplanes sp.]|uniref:hypothetical protein n=1 Tax=Pseudorhodoplanes sp. TaxID=1934341 RepID=UPI003D1015CE
MKSIFAHGVLCAAVTFAAHSAFAQTTPPNLVGTWKGKAEAVIIGANPYRVTESPGPNFGGAMEFTYIIKQQQGVRFTGELSAKVTETIIGTLRPPEFRSGIMLDNDGEYDFTLRDATTMDVCYRHINLTSKAVACWTMQKQP